MQKEINMNNITQREQREVQNMIEQKMLRLLLSKNNKSITIGEDECELGKIDFEAHQNYLQDSLINLGYGMRWYDTGHPWVVYWITNSLQILQGDNYQTKALQQNIVKFLGYCQHPNGGFCGGHGQLQQLASTYAAVLALLIVGTQEAYKLINRQTMLNFLLQVKNQDGSFRMADRGETDLRGSYIAVIITQVLNIKSDKLMDKVPEFISQCQTYEGGLGPIPFSEAHGGLTFCGVAALAQLNQLNKINIQKLTYWLCNRQMTSEGGFQGRTNKLVDACYSFWQGAVFRLIADATNGVCTYENQLATGGFYDKPGKRVDLYHTCYTLAGLTLSQQTFDRKDYTLYEPDITENILREIDPIYNIPTEKLKQAQEYFSKLEPITD